MGKFAQKSLTSNLHLSNIVDYSIMVTFSCLYFILLLLTMLGVQYSEYSVLK